MADDSPDSVKTTLTKSAAAWLFGQPFNNVLLVALLAVFVGAAYLIRNDVPKHLDQIQQGYERISAEQSRQIQYITETHERQHDRDGEVVRELLKSHGINVGDDALKKTRSPLVLTNQSRPPGGN